LVRRDQSNDDVRRWFEALEEVLVVSQPLPHWEAFDVLELHVYSRLGHRQRNGHPSTDAALDCRPDQRSRVEERPVGARTKSARTSAALRRDSTSASSSAQNKC
jgi:hypothetical protein